MYKFYDLDNIISIQQVRSNTAASFKNNISSESHEYRGFKGGARAELATEKDEAFKQLNTGNLSTLSLKNH